MHRRFEQAMYYFAKEIKPLKIENNDLKKESLEIRSALRKYYPSVNMTMEVDSFEASEKFWDSILESFQRMTVQKVINEADLLQLEERNKCSRRVQVNTTIWRYSMTFQKGYFQCLRGRKLLSINCSTLKCTT